MILNETYTLSNGVNIPKLGPGTWMIDDTDASEAVRQKVAAEAKSYETAAQSITTSLEKMGLDYIDMMIIHSPLDSGRNNMHYRTNPQKGTSCPLARSSARWAARHPRIRMHRSTIDRQRSYAVHMTSRQ